MAQWNSDKAAKLLKDLTAYIDAAGDRWYPGKTIKKLQRLLGKAEAARQAEDLDKLRAVNDEIGTIIDESIREYCSKAADGRLVWEYVAYAVKAYAEHEAKDGQVTAHQFAFITARAGASEHWDEMEKRPALKPIVDILGKITTASVMAYIPDWGQDPEGGRKQIFDLYHEILGVLGEAPDFSEKQEGKQSDGYPFILQGAFTNSLKTIGRRLPADRTKTTQKGIVGTEIETGNIFFLAYDAVGALPMNAQKTFDMLIEKAAKAIPNDVRTVTETEAAAYTKHVITLDEYVEFTGMKDRKAASRQLEEGLEALFNAVIDATPTAKERKRNGKTDPVTITAKGRILQNYEYKRGKGKVTFTNNVMQAIISTSSLMPWNHAAYRINGQYNPNSYYLANRLYTDFHMNQSKPNAGRISVKKLIAKAPAIPSYEDVMAGDGAVGRRIVEPFERDMDNLILMDILEEWLYCNSKGVPLTNNQAELKDFKTFESLLISYKLKDYPAPPPKKIETRKKTTRKTAKGQS